MSWYKEAAKAYRRFLGKDAYTEIPVIHHLQETDPRFHFSAGMQIRNELRELGFTDAKYGNLDDHYQEILKILYKEERIVE